jgi:hypothetical protein
MARLHHVKAARRDYPEHGIKRGEEYFWWQKHRSPKTYSKTRPKPHQLINSPFLAAVCELGGRLDELETTLAGRMPCDLSADIRDIVGDIESLKDETEDKLNNMPEGLQQGDTGQLLQSRVDSLDEWSSSLESVADELDDIEEAPEANESKQTEMHEEMESALGNLTRYEGE